MKSKSLPHLLSTGEAAKRFGTTPDTVRRWVREGRLRAQITGGPKGDMFFEENYIARLAREGTPHAK